MCVCVCLWWKLRPPCVRFGARADFEKILLQNFFHPHTPSIDVPASHAAHTSFPRLSSLDPLPHTPQHCQPRRQPRKHAQRESWDHPVRVRSLSVLCVHVWTMNSSILKLLMRDMPEDNSFGTRTYLEVSLSASLSTAHARMHAQAYTHTHSLTTSIHPSAWRPHHAVEKGWRCRGE
jgi:hypothetical protein